MKHLLFIAFLAFSGSAAAQITSSGRVHFETGSLQSFSSPTIYANPTYNPILEQVRCKMLVSDPATTDIIAEFVVVFSKATVDAKTGTGTGDTAKFLNAVYQCVKDHLEAITDNSTVTFTL